MDKILFSFCIVFISQVWSFNFATKYAQVLTINKPRSYFGYSVLLRASVPGHPPSVLVGAPRGNSSYESHRSLVEPGVLYDCPVSNGGALPCKQFVLDPLANSEHYGVTGFSYVHRKDHAWFGMALDGGRYVNESFMVCGPRWINQASKYWSLLMNGLCYWLSDSLNTAKTGEQLIPLLPKGKQAAKYNGMDTYYYAMGEAGFSVHQPKESSEFYIGAPGVLRWKGSVIRIQPQELFGSPVQRRALPSTLDLGKQFVLNPEFMQQIDPESYFGYSLSSGKFLGPSKATWYVGSAPRGVSLRGQVFVFEFPRRKDDAFVVHYEINGEQMGEYFGASVVVTDITGDGADDLLVGAPMHSIKGDEGCVYVYISSGTGSFSVTRLDAPHPSRGSRYGATVAEIGDVNRDSYKDVAIAAPYENDGRGGVYIYLGSPGGLRKTYSQHIKAADVDPGVQTFGTSVSGGVDIDSNHYNDLAIGAYKSGHVAVIRSRSVVSFRPELTANVTEVAIYATGFAITGCIRYEGEHVSSSLDLKLTFVADAEYKRVYFMQSKDPVLHVNKNVATGEKFCNVIDVRITNGIKDYTIPISLEMRYEIDSSDGGVFCPACPVVDPDVANSLTLAVPYVTGCGPDLICQPELKIVKYRFGDGSSSFIIGSSKTVSVEVVVLNSGEPAFLTHLAVELPSNIPLAHIPKMCEKKDDLYVCLLGNPLKSNETKTAKLELDVSALSSGDDELSIAFNLTSVGEEVSPIDNVDTFRIPLVTSVNVDIVGKSVPDQIFYVHENGTRKYDHVTFTQNYVVRNSGLSPLDALDVNFLVPHRHEATDENILDVYLPEAFMDGQPLVCTSRNYSFYDPDTFVYENITGTFRTKRQATGLRPSVLEGSVDETGTAYSETHLPSNRTLFLNCTSPGVKCLDVKCSVSNLKSPQIYADIRLKLRANLKEIAKLLDKRDIVLVTTTAVPASRFIPLERTNPMFVDTVLMGTFQEEEVSNWVIIVSVLAGIIILALIIFGLFKAGFFRRNKPDASKLIEETEPVRDEMVEENAEYRPFEE